MPIEQAVKCTVALLAWDHITGFTQLSSIQTHMSVPGMEFQDTHVDRLVRRSAGRELKIKNHNWSEMKIDQLPAFSSCNYCLLHFGGGIHCKPPKYTWFWQEKKQLKEKVTKSQILGMSPNWLLPIRWTTRGSTFSSVVVNTRTISMEAAWI